MKQMLPDERSKKLKELAAELTRLRTTVASGGTVENPSRIREIKKTIARILTMENEEKLKVKA
jgi:large subunit ribosomal protein L29